MNRLVAFLFLAAVSAAPLANKCPNLTKLAGLRSCELPFVNETRTITSMPIAKLPRVFCLLYNDSFNKLCESHDVDNKTWNETLALVTKSTEDLCGVLVGTPSKLNESEPWVHTIAGYFKSKCASICTVSEHNYADECVKPAVFLKLIPERNETVAPTTKPAPQSKLPTPTINPQQTAGSVESHTEIVSETKPKVPGVPEDAASPSAPPSAPAESQSSTEKKTAKSTETVADPKKTLPVPSPDEQEEEGFADSAQESTPTSVTSPPVKSAPPFVNQEPPPVAKLQNEDETYKDDDEYSEDIVAKPSYSMVEKVPAQARAKAKPKPLETDEDSNVPPSYANQPMTEDDSYFFSYFMMVCIVFILGYVGYHNKQKLLALVLEGRRGKKQQRRRPNSANYHKLDSNLEEAVTSACNKNTASVIY